MSTTLYVTANQTVTSHRFRRATGRVHLSRAEPIEVNGYRLATAESNWLIHRPVRNGYVVDKGWALTHSSHGLGIGYTFDTLDSAKSLVLSFAESTGTDSTPALDATPFGATELSAEALVELRRVKAVFDAWLKAR